MGIAKCSKLVAVVSSFGLRFSGVYIWGKLLQTPLVRKLMACCLIILWLRNRPAIGTNRTLGILCGSLVSWTHWAVLPSRGDCRTGVASVAGGSGRRGSVRVIGGTVFGTWLRVRR